MMAYSDMLIETVADLIIQPYIANLLVIDCSENNFLKLCCGGGGEKKAPTEDIPEMKLSVEPCFFFFFLILGQFL